MMIGAKGMNINREEYVKVTIQPQYTRYWKRTIDFSCTYQPTEFERLRTQFVNVLWGKCTDTPCRNDVSEAVFLICGHEWLLESLTPEFSLPISNIPQNEYARCRLQEGDFARSATLMANVHEKSPYGYIDGLNKLSFLVKLQILMLKKQEDWLPPSVAKIGFARHSAQIESCLYHNAESEISLYLDHSCGIDQLPTKILQVLTVRSDAVWHVRFSHNGKCLASASCDHSGIIWENKGMAFDSLRSQTIKICISLLLC